MSIINKKTCSIGAIIAVVVALFGSEIRTTEEGLIMNGNAEGCIAEPYQCQAGKNTVGIGSTSSNIESRIYSDSEIAERWVNDIKTAEKCVNQYFNGALMGQFQFDAMTDLVFNIGCYGVRWNSRANRPTMIYQYAQGQNWRKMCEHIPDFVYVNGKKNKGLINRRQINLKHCLTGL